MPTLPCSYREEEPVATADEEAAAAELDPEALKDALVEQARAQRRALLQAALRPGTGRQPRSRKISITLPPLQLEEDEPAEEEVQHGEAAPGDEAALTVEELAALADAELAVQQLHDSEAAWECMAAEEEGMLAQAAAGAAPQPADAATPGAALWQQEQQAEYGGAAGDEMQPGTSQHGQARTPATSLLGRYTPMEGVPERLALLATRGKGGASLGGAALPATGSRSVRPAGTPAGFTPLEGIPERLHAFQPLPGATRVLSNLGVPSVDSPVEGLVHEAARRRSIGAAQQPADVPVAAAAEGEGEVAAGGSFGGFARLAEQAEAAAAEAGTAAGAAAAAAAAALPVDDDDDDDDVGGGFADDGGFDDEGALLLQGRRRQHLLCTTVCVEAILVANKACLPILHVPGIPLGLLQSRQRRALAETPRAWQTLRCRRASAWALTRRQHQAAALTQLCHSTTATMAPLKQVSRASLRADAASLSACQPAMCVRGWNIQGC